MLIAKAESLEEADEVGVLVPVAALLVEALPVMVKVTLQNKKRHKYETQEMASTMSAPSSKHTVVSETKMHYCRDI